MARVGGHAGRNPQRFAVVCRPPPTQAARASGCRSCRARRDLRARRSRAVGESSRTPARNRRVLATTWTTGTASASAQGQVMIRTAVAITSARSQGKSAQQHPAQEGEQRRHVHDRRVGARHPVGERDKPRSAALGRLDQADDLGQQRVLARGRDPHPDGAPRLTMPAKTLAPGATLTGTLSPLTTLHRAPKRPRSPRRQRPDARPPPPGGCRPVTGWSTRREEVVPSSREDRGTAAGQGQQGTHDCRARPRARRSRERPISRKKSSVMAESKKACCCADPRFVQADDAGERDADRDRHIHVGPAGLERR